MNSGEEPQPRKEPEPDLTESNQLAGADLSTADAASATDLVTEGPVISDGKAAYNVVSDTVTGVNLRKSDNLMQAAVIGICMVLFAIVGIILAIAYPGADTPWFVGGLIGGFVGVVFGLLTSGVFLMIFRAIMHLSGRHK